MHDWILSVNGERLFAKGANLGPTRMQLAEATATELATDVELAKDAGLDLLRVHAHISRPELYEAADEAGMLVWQDFPLQWGYARGIRKQAVAQVRDAVDLLAHHPSIAVWCGHNEPLALDVAPGGDFDLSAIGRRMFVAQQLPTWNKTVLDRSVKRAFEKADGTRPVIAHSGVVPHPPQLDGTDSHLYFGWYHGDERDFAGFSRAWPRMVRFLSEFGAQAVPTSAGFMHPERWPDLDWERLGHTHGLQRRFFDRYVPPADHPTFDSWRDATQAYQATVLRHHIETLRRLKYRPTGGFAMFSLVDGHPSVTWSVLDHERVPKEGYAALKAVCRPVIVVADRLPAEVSPGDALALDVHIVNDLRAPVEGRVTARLSWPGGDHTWHFGGEVAADSCELVGTLQFVVPDLADPGPGTDGPATLRLELALTAGDHGIDNEYTSTIRPTPVTP
jgi:beta-mannosidase